MAQYKVPQDVEAEDKLIGPFSFRQFIYLGVAAVAIVVAVGLWQLFPGLILIPLPIILLFLVLALPLRKDQPMETYLTAVIRFFLKPRQRLWQPEGSIDLVTIVAPRTPEMQLTKNIGGAAAAAQLGYLAQVVDTQGWATRGVVNPTASMNDIAYAEAQQAEDVFDENTNVVRTFSNMLDKSNDDRKQSVMQRFREAAEQRSTPPLAVQPTAAGTITPVSEPPPTVTPSPMSSVPAVMVDPPVTDEPPVSFNYNPYPSSMHQHVLNPIGVNSPQQPAVSSPKSGQGSNNPPAVSTNQEPSTIDPSSTSVETVSPDIIRLANNNDLSISALANEAHRLSEKNEEVVINLH